MKKSLLLLVLIIFSSILIAYEKDYTFNPNLSTMKYGLGDFKEKGHGNYRAVIDVTNPGEFVRVNIEWRRHDPNPQDKGIVVENQKGEKVNSKVIKIENITGDIVFEAKEKGTYYIYYMPYTPNENYYVQNSDYYPARNSSDINWLNKLDNIDLNSITKANCTEIEARGEFNSPYPMEVVATEEETNKLLGSSPNPYLVFAEDRIYQIRLKQKAPYKWYKSGEITDFIGTAQPNEIYTFQIGLYAKKDIKNLTVVPSDFVGNKTIKSSDIHCINTGGKDTFGKPFTKTIDIKKGFIQPLWFYVQMPRDAKGWYNGTVTIKSDNEENRTVHIKIGIKGDIIENGGIDDLWRMSRISWLDSDRWISDDVIAPYTPIKVNRNKASLNNRDYYFTEEGLPLNLTANNRNILNSPIELNFYSNNKKIDLKKTSSKTLVKNQGAYEFENKFTSENMDLDLNCRLEFDGVCEYSLKVKANKDFTLSNAELLSQLSNNIAKYTMGLGMRGGNVPKSFHWEFNPNRLDYMLWIGDYNAGMQITLQPKDKRYRLWGPIKTEQFNEGWYNGGKGFCNLTQNNNNYTVKFESGEREFKAGETCNYDFRIITTPFHDILPRDFKIRSSSNTISNLFHGSETNPYINYPFWRVKEMKAARDENYKEAETNGQKMPANRFFQIIYYTSRELSNHCYEIWALRSLGDEIFDNHSLIYTGNGAKYISSSGGGYQWLYEHLETDYVIAWHMPIPEDHDAAIANKWDSRWLNYYVEGLNYLMREAKIDGVYLDGIGYGREIMKRVSRVLASYEPDYIIEFHAGNNYDWNHLYMNAYNSNMESLPYVTRMYVGEFFDFKRDPVYMLTEISGIPFGFRNEVLDFYKDGDNPWRQQVFAMTGWAQTYVESIYDLWDRVDISNRKLIGAWSEHPVVKTNNEKAYSSAFVKDKNALVCIANWDNKPIKINVDIDFKALGIDPNNCKITQEHIIDLQKEKELTSLNDIELPVNGGIIFTIQSSNNK